METQLKAKENMSASQEQFQKIRDVLEQLDQLPNTDMENRRKSPRISIHTTMAVSLLSSNAPTTVEVYTRNISLAGFGFVSRRMFRKDERIALLLTFPSLPSKLILARITFVRYISNGLYEMGSEFLECVTDPKLPVKIPSHWSHAMPAVKSDEQASHA